MEFTNEIYFDRNLVENEKVKLYYTGKLFREFSNEVYIVYGYGPNWENTQEQQLNLTDENFNIEINITGKDTFNFCFRNNYNIWDNNNNQDYTATILPQKVVNSNENSYETICNQNSNENSYETICNQNSNDIFTDLLESLLSDIETSNSQVEVPSSEVSYGLQNFSSIESTPSEQLNNLFDELFNEYENIEPCIETQNINETDLDTLFNKIFNYEEAKTEENIMSSQENKSASSEIEELMNNILNSVLESDSINDNLIDELDIAIDNQVQLYTASMEENIIPEESTQIISEDNKKYEDIANAQVPAVISTSKIDQFFDASIVFLQNLGVACKKLFTLVKLKAQELGFIKEDN